MKRIISSFAAFLLAAGLFLLPPLTASAAGSTQIGISKSSISAGDTFSVTIKASEPATVQLRFTAGRLTLTDAGSGSADGNTVTFSGTGTTLRFKAAEAGKAEFIVSSPDGSATGCSAAVTIGAGAAETPAAPAEQPAQPANGADTAGTETPPADASAGQTGEQKNYDLEYDGAQYAVSEKYNAGDIPVGFEKKTLSINGKTFSELSNGKLTLVYLKQITDGKMADTGSFFMYDEEGGTVTGPVEMIGEQSSYVLTLDPDEKDLPEGLTKTSFEIGEGESAVTITRAYTLKGAGEGYYYVYGMKEDGTTDWFRYATADGSLQIADETLLENISRNLTDENSGDAEDTADQPGVKEGASAKTIRLVKGIILAFIILVVILILVTFLSRRKREEDDDDFDEEGPAATETPAENVPVKEEKISAKKAAAETAVPDVSVSEPVETEGLEPIADGASEEETDAGQKDTAADDSMQAAEKALADKAIEEARAARAEEEERRSSLYWARKNFYGSGEKNAKSTDEKPKKGQKKDDGGSASGGDGGIDIMDLNDL